MLSRLAREFAAEIANHDWSDAPWRIDRAGHQRSTDTNRGPNELTDKQTDNVKLNVTWVVAQVLGHADPNLDIKEFAAAAGVQENRPGILRAGLRAWNNIYASPGTFDFDPDGDTAGQDTALPAESGPQRKSVLKVTLPLDAEMTWADLRRFVELGGGEDSNDKVLIEYDVLDSDQMVGLSTYANT